MMITRYLFSDPEGDIPIGPHELATKFKITPSENHPFLTLGDYFEAIRKFILKDQTGPLSALLKDRLDKGLCFDRINKLLIRSEKHGALYHLASVEIFIDGRPVKYGVNTAISDIGKKYLNREYDVLNYLEESFRLPYLPKVFFKGEIESRIGAEKGTFSMFLAEWFEGYYEWHLSMDKRRKRLGVIIWDLVNGHRYASKEEIYEIFRGASKILTLYYDTQNYHQIYPWHHAAGDFVVKKEDGKIDVKLTTARRYGPVMVFLEQGHINPWVAITCFLLDLTIKMRLDKLDGVGGVAWAKDMILRPVIEGFFEGLKVKEAQGSYQLGNVGDLLTLLKGFNQEELKKVLISLRDFHRGQDPEDYKVIRSRLNLHAGQVYSAIQGFHL